MVSGRAHIGHLAENLAAQSMTGLFNAASDWATLALLPSGGSVNGKRCSGALVEAGRWLG